MKPTLPSTQTKATATDQASREIISTEAVQRARKTERLCKLREAKEAATIAVPSVRGKKPASSGKQ